MSPEVYKLRRQVIDLVHEAKALLNGNMPRVEVRIVDLAPGQTCTLGYAGMGENVLWIPESTLGQSDDLIRHTVFHELLHAIWAVPHIEDSPLMRARLEKTGPISKSVASKWFVKHVQEVEAGLYGKKP